MRWWFITHSTKPRGEKKKDIFVAENKAKDPEGAEEDLADGADVVVSDDDIEEPSESVDESKSIDVERRRPRKKLAPTADESDEWDALQEEAKVGVEKATRAKLADSHAVANVKKNRPTRTRAQATAADAPKKTGPGQFVGQVVQELKKVSWPSRTQMVRFFIVVLVFVVFMIALISGLDVLFGWAMLQIFG